MLAVILILALAACLLIALSARPRRTFVALPVAIVLTVLLIEGAGVNLRGAVAAGLIAAFLLAVIDRNGTPATTASPETLAADGAWNRLYRAGGILTRGRIAALRKRRDTLVARCEHVNPFSTFGELRLKLERRVPELIDNYLDEAATAPTLRRQVLLHELVGEVEGLVRRAEAVDPNTLSRSDRRSALRNHLRSGDDPTRLS